MSGHRWQYGAFALHTGYQRLKIYTQNYVILIAFPLPQCVQESASVLRRAYVACLRWFNVWVPTYCRV